MDFTVEEVGGKPGMSIAGEGLFRAAEVSEFGGVDAS